MQFASRWVSKANAIYKAFFNYLSRRAFKVTLALFIVAGGYVSATTSDEQSTNTANNSYVDAVWIGQADRLNKIADADGSALLAISGLGSRAIAILFFC